jgi:2-phosphoglycerate kinase
MNLHLPNYCAIQILKPPRQFWMILSVLSLEQQWPRFFYDRQRQVDRLRRMISYLRRYEQYSPLLYTDADILTLIVLQERT